MTNKAWCPLPWMSLNVRNNGDLRICCQANSGFDQGLIRKEDGTVYNLGKDDFNDSRNAELLKDVRKSMLNGEFHPSCLRCKRETEAGMASRASIERTAWNHIIDENKAREITRDDGSIDIDQNPIIFADLRFGNLCNLKCRMCGPTDSNQWYAETVKLWGNQYKDSSETITLVPTKNGKFEPSTDKYSWYENSSYWETMEELIPSIESLYIVGGEPLLIDQHYDFLQRCIDLGYAKNIVVEYNSNITNIPQRAWNIWKHFKSIRIGISVDAVGPLNDYIRNPSKWKKIEENMRKLDAADGNFKLWWSATIQVYNLINLPEMLIWKIEQNFQRINKTIKNKPIISPHPVHVPKFLNIKIFPKESKEHISSYFESCKDKAKETIYNLEFMDIEEKDLQYKTFCDILDHYNNYMWAEDYSDNLQQFWHFNKTLDKSRNESLKNVCLKTWELLYGDRYDR